MNLDKFATGFEKLIQDLNNPNSIWPQGMALGTRLESKDVA